MIVRSVNGISPVEGNVELPMVSSIGKERGLRMWSGTVDADSGEFTVDYS